MDPVTLFLLGTVISAGVAAYNSNSQDTQNAVDRGFQRDLYNKQRADALADTAAANTYNHPTQQMNRLRQAGLNPNLVYGTGAANTAEVTRATQSNPQSQIAPKIDPSAMQNTLAMYQNAKVQEAQISATQENTRLAVKQGLLVDSEIANKIASKDATLYATEQAKRLQDSTITQANLTNQEKELGNKLKSQELVLNLERNDREKIANTTNIAKTMQDILQSKEQTKNIKLNSSQERELRQLDIDLKRSGLQPHDALYQRKIITWYEKLMERLKETGGLFGGADNLY